MRRRFYLYFFKEKLFSQYTMTEKIFYNYQQLLNKVDQFSFQITQRYRKHMSCGFGCSDCCRQNLNLMPLEFFFLREGFSLLSNPMKNILGNRTSQHPEVHSPCLLLNQGGCLLYEHRPIICRTHGLPLFVQEGGQEKRDCCPKNFASYSLELLPQTDFLHLERLNTILIAVNRVFASLAGIESGIRLPLAKLPAITLSSKTFLT